MDIASWQHRSYFNPRSREGSDKYCRKEFTEYDISIHAPAKGATLPAYSGGIGKGISIHAPAKGATFSLRNNFRGWNISIHAPAKGATKGLDITNLKLQFQSTLPRRERPTPESTGVLHVTISIHAPAKGATCSDIIFAIMH